MKEDCGDGLTLEEDIDLYCPVEYVLRLDGVYVGRYQSKERAEEVIAKVREAIERARSEGRASREGG